MADSTQTLGDSSSLFNLTWISSDFSDANFTSRIVTQNNSTVSVDYIQIKVFYTNGGVPLDTGWKAPTATSGAWTNGSNAFVLDQIYTTDAIASDTQNYTTYGFSIPVGATINGIQIQVVGNSAGIGQQLAIEIFSTSFGDYNGGFLTFPPGINTIRATLPNNDVFTNSNIDHYALVSDSNYILIKEKTRGSITIGNGALGTITHGLGYIPSAFVWVNNGGTQGFIAGGDANSSFPATYSLGTGNTVITNNFSGTKTFEYFIFFDQEV